MAKTVLVTGSGGLIGSESVHFFSNLGYNVVGIDNNMREYYFGSEGSTEPNVKKLLRIYKNYNHYSSDIRDFNKLEEIFKKHKFDLIIHTAAQPSHDWAAKEPLTDFGVNANGTLNLLECFRKHASDGVFIYTSTNKVYGDTPNRLPLIELKTRYEISPKHKYKNGIDETMSIDNSTHSLFGVSKAAADLMVQEYGRYFNFATGVFRGGCLTGSGHAGTEQHGFLSYLVKCILTERKYTIYGYKGKQVRDNIHSHDLLNAFYNFYQKPRVGEVYNMGGSRFANISMIEAIKKIEDISGKKAVTEYKDENRTGDHIWYVSSVEKFKSHYPKWKYEYDIDSTIEDIVKNSAFSKEAVSFSVNKSLDFWREKNWYFHNSLRQMFKSFIPEGADILQIGYGLGDILSSLYPNKAVSLDTDENIMLSAKRRYPQIKFISGKPENLNVKGKFDYVIIPNSVDHLEDIQTVLEKLKLNVTSKSKIMLTALNPKWIQILSVLEKLNLKRAEGEKNWLRLEDLKNITRISGYEIEESGFRVMLPLHIPLVTRWINATIPNTPLFKRFCLEQFIVARKVESPATKKLSCSVVVPCFNEEENIKNCVSRVPKMGKWTEIVVVDDGSTDKTIKVVKQLMKTYKNLKLVSYKPNRGKGWAVKQGMDAARGDVVMILDADMAVPPEELPRFFSIFERNYGNFVNGTRLIYPMEDQAMRQLNLIGNLVFSWIFSWLLGVRITDTLCGTKALYKSDYKNVKMSGKSWGDFDLLFGAAENDLDIIEVPVHYKKRVAGKSKMKAFKHGMVLAKMCGIGFWRLKVMPLFLSKQKQYEKTDRKLAYQH